MSDLKHIVSILPNQPGVYQFYNKAGVILYIGKAKNLKSRVSSYFTKQKYESFKTKKLAAQVYDIKHIVVETESDALLLENNLIKQFQPKYNVLLKDDKTFPWIVIKKEEFPRIFSTRNRINDGSEYFGPYTSAIMVRTLLNLVHQLYPIRTCSYKLNRENISSGKYNVCLQYHIKNCLGACEGLQTEDNYLDTIIHIREILNGNIQEVLDHLHHRMMKLSKELKFEEAEKLKIKYDLLQRYKSKSTIVNPKINNVDVLSFYEKNDIAYVNYLKILNGAIVQSHTVELTKGLEESKEDLLSFALFDIREKVKSNSKEIYLQFSIPNINGLRFSTPQIGDKKKLLDLSYRNALHYASQKEKNKIELSKKYNKPPHAVSQLQTDLLLKELPIHIECFDNSNIQGTSPVAACVVFRNGKPASKDYRHFHIKTVEGANDFASMEEVVYRRYKRLLDEEKTLPQLIIIDGGKGQLSSAVNSLQALGIYGKVAIIGIAKRLEEIYFPGDSVPLYIDKNSSSLKLIQHLRNEAHRFGITFHRKIRSKKMTKTELEDIPGVGDKSIEKLIKNFGSVDAIKKATLEDIAEVVSKKLSIIIFDYFKGK